MLNKTTMRSTLMLYLYDIALTMLSLQLARLVRLWLPFGQEPSPAGASPNWSVYLMVTIIWTAVFIGFSVYSTRLHSRLMDQVRVLLVAIGFSTLSLMGMLYLSFRGLSRLLFAYFFLLDAAALLLLRLAWRAWLARKSTVGQPTYNVLIVGTDPVGQQLARALAQLPWAGLSVVGFVENGTAQGEGSLELPVLGRSDTLEQAIAQADIHEVIFTHPRENQATIARLLKGMEEKPLNVRIVPDLIDTAFFHASVDEVQGIPLIGLKGPVLSEYQRLVKRLVDIVLAGAGLILISPLLLICAVLIRLDSPGPVFYKQQRVGENGRLFWMYKFRTMIPGADKDEGKLIQHDDDGKLVFRKTVDDPRVTRVGRTLRRFSLDELPQFLNVLKGEMSMVGPRPELPALMELYATGQRKRLCAPPGVTGWWQVSGRSDRDKRSQAESDLYYLQNYSLWLDLSILWKTIGAVLRGEGAF